MNVLARKKPGMEGDGTESQRSSCYGDVGSRRKRRREEGTYWSFAELLLCGSGSVSFECV